MYAVNANRNGFSLLDRASFLLSANLLHIMQIFSYKDENV